MVALVTLSGHFDTFNRDIENLLSKDLLPHFTHYHPTVNHDSKLNYKSHNWLIIKVLLI